MFSQISDYTWPILPPHFLSLLFQLINIFTLILVDKLLVSLLSSVVFAITLESNTHTSMQINPFLIVFFYAKNISKEFMILIKLRHFDSKTLDKVLIKIIPKIYIGIFLNAEYINKQAVPFKVFNDCQVFYRHML